MTIRAHRLTPVLLGACLWSTIALAGHTPDPASGIAHTNAETQLLAVLSLARQGDYEGAIEDLSDLVQARPNFRLAQLIYGELMMARTGHDIDTHISPRMRAQRDALLDEARARWAHRAAGANDGKVPAVLIQIAPALEHVIVADLSSNRVYLFANEGGVPRLVSDVYATIGRGGIGKQVEGDMRTPIGVYHVTRYLNDDQLPELYGVGALPVNYPNALDRARGRTGYGIWLHGVPRTTYSRTPRASEGCLVIANDDFNRLKANVTTGRTPVIMADGLDWVPVAEIEQRRTAILAAIEGWRHSWQSIDTTTYLAYYGPDFVSEAGRDKKAFAVYKQQINAAKTAISVELDQISIFDYPGESNMVKVLFKQDYSSNNHHSSDQKAQYWQYDDHDGWQIVLEADDN